MSMFHEYNGKKRDLLCIRRKKLLNFSINNGDGADEPFGERFLAGEGMEVENGAIEAAHHDAPPHVLSIDDNVVGCHAPQLLRFFHTFQFAPFLQSA